MIASNDTTILNLSNNFNIHLNSLLIELHSAIETISDRATADSTVIELLAVNLGYLIGQLQDDNEQHYIDLVQMTLEEQIIEAKMLAQSSVPGMVGHA